MVKNRNRFIGLIKGICILLLLLHISNGVKKKDYFQYSLYLIEMAVPVFMKISGCLWALSLGKKTNTFSEAYGMEYISKAENIFTSLYRCSAKILLIEEPIKKGYKGRYK